MITDADIIMLQQEIEKFYKKLISSQHKTTTDIFGILGGLGDRLASHYTVDGFAAYYRLPNTGGQIISVSVNLNAEKEYHNLPDYYCNMDLKNEDIIHKIKYQKEE